MKKQKTIYYSDPLNDEFSTAEITPKKIDANWRYARDSVPERLAHRFWYRGIFTLPAVLYTKLYHHQKTVGKECLVPFRRQGYFLYGNHTQPTGDAFLPNSLAFPQTVDMIVHPNNVSMPILGRITPYLGALPLPGDLTAARNFLHELEKRVRQGHCVMIYPEAHIWPYYTGIRPFPDDSFQYPIKLGVPSFCLTNTYQKRKGSSRPKIVTYLDGPFYPDESLPLRQRRKDLRDRIYATMCERAQASDCVKIQYIQRDEEHG